MSNPSLNTFSGVDKPDLAELPLPDAVSLFPQTLAWQLLLAAIVLALLFTVLFMYRRHQRRLWRREAYQLACATEQNALADEWFVLIKRVSRLHVPAGQLSAFSDQQLLAQLPGLPASVQQRLTEHHYRRESKLPQADNAQLAMAFHRWLKGLPDV